MSEKMEKEYKVGFTCGVFDLFHVGHLNLFERCKEKCEILIVGLCGDDYVRDIKHKEPVIKEHDRERILKALKCVDDVVPVTIDEINDKMLAYKKVKFDVLFSGDDWKGSERYKNTEIQFAKLGVRIEYLPYTQGVSTTKLKQLILEKQ